MRRVSGLLLASAPVAGLAAVLVILGALQYRWLSQVGEAERERLGRDAQRRAEALAQDFDREITRAYMMLQVPPRDSRAGTASALFAERWDRWTARAPHPGMVAAVYLVEAPPESAAVVSRFDPARRTFVPGEWPEALRTLGRRLDAARSGEPPPMPIVPDVPALVSPVPDVLEIAADTPPSGPGPVKRVLLTGNYKRVLSHRGAGHWPMWGYIVVALDRAYLTGRMLPELAARHLHGENDREYDVTVVDGAATVVWANAAPRASGDAAAPALQVRFDDLERSLLDLEEERGPDRVRFRLAAGVVTSKSTGEAIPAGWRVVLAHRAGSVDALAARLRRRNLAVSFGVLGVLGAAMALVVVSSQRARALAAREMEFVAGVSHELRTPVAVIRSAAENLADGVVADPEQVRRYGGVILDQGARLTGMVEQVLALAGAPARARAPQAIAPADLVRSAVDAPGEPGAPAPPPQLELDPDLPEIAGDPEALRRAVANLVANARRHGRGSPLRVRARRGERGGVDIEVEDRGPGIEPADLPHVFEPFYRGRRAVADQVPGTGLGLAVVRGVMEAHGGRVSVRSRPGDGATFTLHLPAPPSR